MLDLGVWMVQLGDELGEGCLVVLEEIVGVKLDVHELNQSRSRPMQTQAEFAIGLATVTT
jgi:hypothetical protein